MILLVEDNPGDALLVKEAMLENRIGNLLYHVVDGEQALQFLHQQAPLSEVPRPDLILLDLNLPGMDGREVLATIKQDPALLTIPVVVMTSSAAEADILRSYALHANCYVTKPIDLDQFMTVVKSTESFFVTIARRPSNSAQPTQSAHRYPRE